MSELLKLRRLQNALTKIQIAKRLIVESIGDAISNQPEYHKLYTDVQVKVIEVEQVILSKLLELGEQS